MAQFQQNSVGRVDLVLSSSFLEKHLKSLFRVIFLIIEFNKLACTVVGVKLVQWIGINYLPVPHMLFKHIVKTHPSHTFESAFSTLDVKPSHEG